MIKKILKKREVTAFIFMILIFLMVGLINPQFLKFNNLMSTFKSSIMYIVLAIGMSFVIFTKEIDVSVGSTLGLSAAVSAMLLKSNVNIMLVILGALLVGIVCGLINGIGVARFKIPSIVMTLGTMGIVRGIIYIYTGGKWVENLPDYFKKLSQVNILGSINMFVLVTIVAVILIQLYISRSKKGKYFKAVGDNQEGALLVGIKVNKVKILSFVISGLCASIAGLIYVSQVGFVSQVAGNGVEMTAIAACVLGGVSLNGGLGSITGACIGGVIINCINSALVFLKVPAYWNDTISGLLLIVIVVADVLIQKRISEKARKERLSARTIKIGGNINE